jgi:hypothetical protein
MVQVKGQGVQGFDVRGGGQRCDWSVNAYSVCAQYEFPGYGFFSANHNAVFPLVRQTTEFRLTTVVEPSQFWSHGFKSKDKGV